MSIFREGGMTVTCPECGGERWTKYRHARRIIRGERSEFCDPCVRKKVGNGRPEGIDPESRFWERITVDPGTGCWLFENIVPGLGYSAFSVNGRRAYVHRWSYERFKGPIPEGLQIDHLCRVRNCVNPEHLEAVTHEVNILRGFGFGGINKRKTHCKHGHPFDEQNTNHHVVENGRVHRRCLACARRMNARRRRQRKEAAMPPS